MDKQELYVAASRSREETFIYATPEIQAHREEIAPGSPHLREGIPHIAEAAERDRSQLAAHEIALRPASMPARRGLTRAMAHLEAEAREMPVAGQTARRELAVADQVLAERRELAIIAARIPRPSTSRTSWGRGRATQRCGRYGIAASPGSSATARSTALRTRAKPLAGRRNEGPSGHASRLQRDGCKRFSEPLAWGSTRRERASSAED